VLPQQLAVPRTELSLRVSAALVHRRMRRLLRLPHADELFLVLGRMPLLRPEFGVR